MDQERRRVVDGWADKATNKLNAAATHYKSREWSETVQAAQECIELSVKSVLAYLGVELPRQHGLREDHDEFSRVAKQIRQKGLQDGLRRANMAHVVILPRLLFLMNLWSHYYLTAKYGYDAENLASARDLFKETDARFALEHAREASVAMGVVRFLPPQQMAVVRDMEGAGRSDFQ